MTNEGFKMKYCPSVISYSLPTKEELPVNTAKWEVDSKRSVLLIHDMQHFFLKPFDERLREKLINNVALLRKWALKNQVPIAYSVQPGGMTEKQRGLLKDFWGSGMQISAEDRDIPIEISPTNADWKLTKWRYSAFFKTNLLELMRQANKNQLIISGVYGHVGILTTSLESYSNDLETFIVADAIADFSYEDHHKMLNYTASRCAVVTIVENVI